jgi:hypothetical protein
MRTMIIDEMYPTDGRDYCFVIYDTEGTWFLRTI